MTTSDALQGISRLFLDAAPLIYFVEQNPRYIACLDTVFDRVDAGSLTAVTSSVTLGEALIQHLYQSGQNKHCGQRNYAPVTISRSQTLFKSPALWMQVVKHS
jgi:hypothetical protein